MERADRITKAGAVANMGMAALKGVVGTAAGYAIHAGRGRPRCRPTPSTP